jgi:hypothetical protein
MGFFLGRARSVVSKSRAVHCSRNLLFGPRGRIVFDRARDLFILYADRKLLTPATIARIEIQFRLPAERTEVKSAFHYQSKETPNVLAARRGQP